MFVSAHILNALIAFSVYTLFLPFQIFNDFCILYTDDLLLVTLPALILFSFLMAKSQGMSFIIFICLYLNIFDISSDVLFHKSDKIICRSSLTSSSNGYLTCRFHNYIQYNILWRPVVCQKCVYQTCTVDFIFCTVISNVLPWSQKF